MDSRGQETQSTGYGLWRDLAANWPTVLAIAALCLISRYWFCSRFGLYEDDYWRIPSALSTPLADIAAGVAVQRDYQRSWQLQRAFWREVAA